MKVIIALLSGDMVHARTAYGSVIPMLFTTSIPRVTRPSIGSFSSHSQNAVVERTMKDPSSLDATHIMFIEPDMMFPANTLDRLIEHDVDIVGATYRRRGPPYDLVKFPIHGAPDIEAEPRPHGAHEWRAIPAGLMLVKMEVLQKIKFPWFMDLPGSHFGDWMTLDMYFCDKARAAGFKVYCDYDLTSEVYHIASMPLGLGGAEAG